METDTKAPATQTAATKTNKKKVAPRQTKPKTKAKTPPKADAKPSKAPRGAFATDAVIRVVKDENPFKGNRGEYHKLIKTGTTVADFLAAMSKKFEKSSTRPLARAVAAGLITVGTKK